MADNNPSVKKPSAIQDALNKLKEENQSCKQNMEELEKGSQNLNEKVEKIEQARVELCNELNGLRESLVDLLDPSLGGQHECMTENLLE